MFSFAKTLGFKIGAGVVSFLLIVIAGLWLYVGKLERDKDKLRQQVHATELAFLNAKALADQTRNVNAQLQNELGTQRNAYERLITQVRRERDAIDKTLQRTTQVLADLQVRFNQLQAQFNAGVTEDSAGVRHVLITNHRPAVCDSCVPFTIDTLKAVVPPPPDSATVSITVSIDPFKGQLRIQCSDRIMPGGAREATALMIASNWGTVDFGTLQQDPDVCSPRPTTTAKPAPIKSAAIGGVIGGVVGAVVGGVEKIAAGGLVGAGVGVLLNLLFGGK